MLRKRHRITQMTQN